MAVLNVRTLELSMGAKLIVSFKCLFDHPGVRTLAWIMTRSPEIDAATYTTLRTELETRNFDLKKLQLATHEPTREIAQFTKVRRNTAIDIIRSTSPR